MGLSRPPIERLMEKVRKLENGCWQWAHYVESNGYARIWVDGRNVLAHRWSYEHHVGPIPSGLEIDHLCRNRACVNPAHLEPVTTSVNVLRSTGPAVARARCQAITHCPDGHPYDEENTYSGGSGRTCRTCKRRKAREYYERNRDLVIKRSAAWQAANPERHREIAREAQRRQRAKQKAA